MVDSDIISSCSSVTVSFVLNLVKVPEYDPMLKITHFKVLPEKNLTVTSYTGCLDRIDITLCEQIHL